MNRCTAAMTGLVFWEAVVFSFSLGVTGQSKQDPSQGFAWWIQGREGSARRNYYFLLFKFQK